MGSNIDCLWEYRILFLRQESGKGGGQRILSHLSSKVEFR